VAYSDSIGDNAELLKRTLTHVTDFSGRSRRTEVIYYWIAAVLIGVVLNFTATMFAPYETSLLVAETLRFVIVIPMFALFVRRVHDQSRSGWWAALLPLSVLLSLPLVLTEVRGDVSAIMAAKTSAPAVVSGVLGLAVFVICLLPGTEGANRYGPDPRLE
jgi:uncharacterized membrane protein YhaH (DUF805 family)